MKFSLAAHSIYASLLLAGLSACSSNTENADPATPHSVEDLRVTINEDNAYPLLRLALSAPNVLLDHAPYMSNDFPNFHFGRLDPDTHSATCTYSGGYTFDMINADAQRPQQNSNDWLLFQFDECDSDFGIYNGSIERTVLGAIPRTTDSPYFSFEYLLQHDNFRYAWIAEDSGMSTPLYALSGAVSIRDIYEPERSHWSESMTDLIYSDFSRGTETLYNMDFAEDFLPSEQRAYWLYSGEIEHSEFDGIVVVSTVAPFVIDFSSGYFEPQAGELLIEGRSGSSIKLTLAELSDGDALIEVDSDGDGVIDDAYEASFEALLQ